MNYIKWNIVASVIVGVLILYVAQKFFVQNKVKPSGDITSEFSPGFRRVA